MILPKRSLVRIVRTEEGVRIDPTGKLPGRGAYLHDKRSCWVKALKGPLAGALKTSLSEQDLGNLASYMESLPAEENDAGSPSDGVQG